MILQRDGRMRKEIQEYGCALMSILWFANKFTNMQIDPASVSDGMYVLFQRHGWMTDTCKILKWQEIFNWCGVKCTYTNRHEPPDRYCDDDEFEILCWKHPVYGWHFTAGDGAGRCTYDPYGVSKAATEGTLISKRIFRLQS